MTTIAVIGAGFSGTLLTLHLLRYCPPPTRLLLIERNSQFGRGLEVSPGIAQGAHSSQGDRQEGVRTHFLS